jgi:hypothetical protein
MSPAILGFGTDFCLENQAELLTQNSFIDINSKFSILTYNIILIKKNFLPET